MFDLPALGIEIAGRRKALNLRQADLAGLAGLSRATIEALENGRLGELGIGRVSKILAVLGLTLSLAEAPKRRPTLDDLRKEDA